MDNTSSRQNSHNPDEVSLKKIIAKIQELFRYLLSKWLFIICAALIGGIIGVVYAWSKKPLYKAEITFTLQDDKASSSLASKIGLTSTLGLDLGSAAGGEFSGDNLLELMKSRYIITKTLLTPVTINNKKTTLVEYYIQINELRKGWENNPKINNIQFPSSDTVKLTLQQDSLLGIFHKSLVGSTLSISKLDKNLSIISLQVKSTNELFSKVLCETLAKVVSDYYVETKTAKERKTVTVLQKQTDSIRYILYGKLVNIAQTADATPNLNPTKQILRVPSQRNEIEAQTNKAIMNELIKNLETSKMSLLQQTPLIQVIDAPILPLEKQRIGKASAGLTGAFVLALLVVIFHSLSFLYKSLEN